MVFNNLGSRDLELEGEAFLPLLKYTLRSHQKSEDGLRKVGDSPKGC